MNKEIEKNQETLASSHTALGNSQIHIYVVCHKDAFVPKNHYLIPIQVGAANSKTRLSGMEHDDTGENISARNGRYCELTAQYWAWKNVKADYYGFFHYRRYFSFNPETLKEDGWGNIAYPSITPQAVKELCLQEDKMADVITKYDVITLRARDINNIPGDGPKTNFTNYTEYGTQFFQHEEDLALALRVLREKYPQYGAAAEHYMADSHAYECNMFIMNRAEYDKYCSWLFDILFDVEKQIDFSEYSRQENRVMGYLAERLFGIYYTYLKEEGRVRTHELQKTIFRNTDKPVRINPLFWHDEKLQERMQQHETQPGQRQQEQPCAAQNKAGQAQNMQQNDTASTQKAHADSHAIVPIVLAANDRFVPYLATMMASVIAHASPQTGYDMVVLHRDISADNQKLIKGLAAGKANICIRFANVQAYFDQLELFIDQHLSIETYYRLVIPDIMPDYDKILYLDADMVAERDVAELYQLELGEHAIAGAKDIDIAGQARQNRALVPYLTETIGLASPFDYFQAGVLVLSLKKLSQLASVPELLKTAHARSWKCHDQDVLNHVCRGHVSYLPQQWNVLMNWKEGERSRMQVLQCAPEHTFAEYEAARENPYIVHFAGYQKPWNMPVCDMAPYFWKYAKLTPYYESMLFSKTAHNETDVYVNGVKEPLYANGVVVKMIAMMNRLLPIGSRRRAAVRKVAKVFIR